MLDFNSLLLILQASSMTIMLSLALLLSMAWFHQPDTNREYEQMRWSIVTALVIMGLHYLLQMHFGFRAQGADVGALVNTLFYAPAIYIFSYSFVRLAGGRSFRRRFIAVVSVFMLIIVGCFLAGFVYYRSNHMPVALYAMGATFFASIIFCFGYPYKEIRRIRRLADEESGQMPVQFDLFLRTSSILLYSASLVMSLSIYFNPLVFIVGTLNLIAILFFVVSFTALGFNICNVDQLISVETNEAAAPSTDSAGGEAKSTMSAEQTEMVRTRIEEWKSSQGYASADLNSITLASHLRIPRRHLVQYLRDVEGKTFRIWLSDLRLEEAKRLIIAHPEYSNVTIAETCGFSRSHLQAKFKEATGMTINDWRAAQSL